MKREGEEEEEVGCLLYWDCLLFFFESAKIFHLPHFFLSADTQPAGLNAADFFERVRRHTHIAADAFFVFDEDDEYWWYYQ